VGSIPSFAWNVRSIKMDADQCEASHIYGFVSWLDLGRNIHKRDGIIPLVSSEKE